ncbi:unnamed protein product [Choristocarpus tenellus]
MCEVEYQGAATDIPMRALHFLVNRYTNAGNTVVSFSTERHNVVEAVLELSSRVEVFVSNAASKNEVKEKMKTSFGQAYKDSKWKVSTSLVQDRVIGPSCLPEALGQTLVPMETQRCFSETVNPPGKAMGRDEATVFVAKTVATDFGYQIEMRASSSSNPAEMALFSLEGKDYKVGGNDLPAWGDLEVCNSRSEAFRSLLKIKKNSAFGCFMWLTTNSSSACFHLEWRCVGRAQSSTCAWQPLALYMRWTEKADDANIEFTSIVPQS